MLTLLFVVGIVLLVSAFCNLSEAVLYSVPISHIESLAASGHPAGQTLRLLRYQIDRPIAAILILNTIANIAGATIAGALLVAAYGPRWLAPFSVFMTIGILIFSEMIPKTLGVKYNRNLVIKLAHPIRILMRLLSPFVALSQLVTRIASKSKAEEHITDAELVAMARLGLRTGSLVAREVDVIENVLSLESKKARSIMTPRSVVFSLGSELSVEEALKAEGIKSYSRIPVFEENADDIVGIVHTRELFLVGLEEPESRLEHLMHPVHFVPESAPLDKLLRAFLQSRQHMFMVIDEFGALAGVITLEDILEELLGHEIIDEFDRVVDLRELARLRREKILKKNA